MATFCLITIALQSKLLTHKNNNWESEKNNLQGLIKTKRMTAQLLANLVRLKSWLPTYAYHGNHCLDDGAIYCQPLYTFIFVQF